MTISQHTDASSKLQLKAIFFASSPCYLHSLYLLCSKKTPLKGLDVVIRPATNIINRTNHRPLWHPLLKFCIFINSMAIIWTHLQIFLWLFIFHCWSFLYKVIQNAATYHKEMKNGKRCNMRKCSLAFLRHGHSNVNVKLLRFKICADYLPCP